MLVDVFTDRPLTGNQLAVFTDARGLSAETMQAIAREMHFSESVFLLPAGREAEATIRIFTPKRELPFAGHPTLGAAFVIGATVQFDALRLVTGRGIVVVRLERQGATVRFGWMAQPLPTWEPFAGPEALCRALGVAGSELPITVYDNGVRHAYVMLPSRQAVAALSPDQGALAALGDYGINAFAGDGEQWKTRMFAPGHGVAEDPATGSAAGPLAAHLVRHGRVPSGAEIQIEQGTELLRPSTLHARVVGNEQVLESVEVGGSAVVVGRGELRIPG